jgi:inorganic triphosphatase YgiF
VERETKLVALPGRCLDDVWGAARELGLVPLEAPRTLPLRARYHDDERGTLRRAGVTLRSRTEGDEDVAALKSPGPVVDGVRARVELECPLPAAPRPGDALPTVLSAALRDGGIDLRQWPPVAFETTIRRVHAVVPLTSGGRAHLCVDEGFVQAGSARDPVAEIELEELEPTGRALVAASLALAERLDLRPGLRTKAARGQRLLGLLGSHRPPGPTRLDAVESLIDLEERMGDEPASSLPWDAELDAIGAAGAPLHAVRALRPPEGNPSLRAAALRALLRWATDPAVL